MPNLWASALISQIFGHLVYYYDMENLAYRRLDLNVEETILLLNNRATTDLAQAASQAMA